MLKSFNEELCNAVTGFDCSKQILEQLVKENLFIVPLDNNRTWYRYHHLFSDFLSAGLDEGLKVKIFRKASTWCRAEGYAELAVEYALEAGDSEIARGPVAHVTSKYLHNGAIGKLLALMDSVKEISSQSDAEVEICRAIS